MAQYSTGDLKPGFKVEVEGEPYNVVSNEFVKPGKGQLWEKRLCHTAKSFKTLS